MKTTTKIKNVTITTTFDNDRNMIESVMSTSDRELKIQLGKVSGTWSLILDSKTQETVMGHNRNLRTYTYKDWEFTVNYWDKKLKEFSI